LESATTDSARAHSAESPIQTDATVESKTEYANPFGILYFDEELLESSVGTPQTSLPIVNAARGQSTGSTSVTYEINNETTDDELHFAIHCFFDDLNRLRDFLDELWSDYKNGRVDLITASVTTNTAIDLVHRAEKELLASFPELDTYAKTGLVFYIFMCLVRGEDPDYREQPGDLFNFAVLDVADWLYLPVYSLLMSFCDVLKDNTAPLMKPGYYGIYDPHTDRSKLTIRQRMLEDRIILLEALPQLFIFTKVHDVPIQDEFTNGLRTMFVQKTVPLWVTTFAAQIFLDIHHTLRVDAIRGLSDLQASGIHASSTLTEYFASSTPFSNWPAQNEQFARNIKHFVDTWIGQDALASMRRRLYQAVSLPDVEPYALFQRHPLLCGLFQCKLYLQLQELGVTPCNAWGSILYVAHLYEGCRQGGYLEEIWPDMKMIMDIHTRERLFAGRVPKTPAESVTCMNLMLGISPASYARSGRRRPGIQQSRRGPKGLTTNSPVTDVFREQFLENGNPRVDISQCRSVTPRSRD
jgi:hypothetical protein